MERLHRLASLRLAEFGIARDHRVLVAVSGGADSSALLRVLAQIGQDVAVAHVHHGLRGDAADADLAFVCAAAQALGVRFHGLRIAVGSGRPGSWEARARAARYAALEEVRRAHGCAWIATAHTRDDQAETVLLRATRGTRLEGLAGIEPLARERHLVRPLLDARRAELREYLRARGCGWREDATNLDPRHPRSRLRLSVLPELEAMQPGAVAHLAALAEQARALRAQRGGSLDAWLERAVEEGEGGLWIGAGDLLALAPDLRRDALARVLRLGCPPDRLRAIHLERAVNFAGAGAGASRRRLSLPGGCVLLRDRDSFWLGPAGGPRWPGAFSRPLEPGLELWLPERRLRLRWQRPGAGGEAPASALRIDARVQPLELRSPRPGDRLVRGARGLSLAAALQRARCSLRERGLAAVVASGPRVLWIPGLPGICAPEPRGVHSEWELVAERVSGIPPSC